MYKLLYLVLKELYDCVHVWFMNLVFAQVAQYLGLSTKVRKIKLWFSVEFEFSVCMCTNITKIGLDWPIKLVGLAVVGTVLWKLPKFAQHIGMEKVVRTWSALEAFTSAEHEL